MRNLLVLAALTMPAVANAQVYVTAHGGLSIPNNPDLQMKTNKLRVTVDDGYEFGGALGYDFGRVRFEVEGSRARATVSRIRDAKRDFLYDEGQQIRESAMANAYVDIPMSSAVTFYVGGGAGISRMRMRAKGGPNCREVLAFRIVNGADQERTGPSGKCLDQGKKGDTGFTWQGIGGFDFNAGKGWSIGPQFRYVAATGIRTAGKSLPTRETRFIDHKMYNSLNALVTLTKRF